MEKEHFRLFLLKKRRNCLVTSQKIFDGKELIKAKRSQNVLTSFKPFSRIVKNKENICFDFRAVNSIKQRKSLIGSRRLKWDQNKEQPNMFQFRKTVGATDIRLDGKKKLDSKISFNINFGISSKSSFKNKGIDDIKNWRLFQNIFEQKNTQFSFPKFLKVQKSKISASLSIHRSKLKSAAQNSLDKKQQPQIKCFLKKGSMKQMSDHKPKRTEKAMDTKISEKMQRLEGWKIRETPRDSYFSQQIELE